MQWLKFKVHFSDVEGVKSWELCEQNIPIYKLRQLQIPKISLYAEYKRLSDGLFNAAFALVILRCSNEIYLCTATGFLKIGWRRFNWLTKYDNKIVPSV